MGISYRGVDQDAWFSGFRLEGPQYSQSPQSTYALIADEGGATLTIEDNFILGRAAGPGESARAKSGGTSYGIKASRLAGLAISGNEIASIGMCQLIAHCLFQLFLLFGVLPQEPTPHSKNLRMLVLNPHQTGNNSGSALVSVFQVDP